MARDRWNPLRSTRIDRPALIPTPFGFPWLASLEGDTYVKRPDGWTFSPKDGERPHILLHLDHQVRELRLEGGT